MSHRAVPRAGLFSEVTFDRRRSRLWWLVVVVAVIATVLVPVAVSSPDVGAQQNTISIRVSAGSDDVEERANGSLIVGSSDLDMDGRYTVGVRFRSVCVDGPDQVASATLAMTSDETDSGVASVRIRGIDVGDAPVFAGNNAVSGGPLTSAQVDWQIPNWVNNTTSSSPDIGAIVKEIVGRPDWQACNDIALSITRTAGSRAAYTVEKDSSKAPLLSITTQPGGPLPTPTPVPPPAGGETLVIPIASAADDVEQGSGGTLIAGSSDLDMDGRYFVGLLFRNVCVNGPADIASATLTMTGDETDSGATSVTVMANKTGDAAGFSGLNAVTGRLFTNERVTWQIPAWNNNTSSTSPELAEVLKEAIGSPGWQACNDVMLRIDTNNGSRAAYTFEKDPNKTAVLTVVTSNGGPPTPTPVPPTPTPVPPTPTPVPPTPTPVPPTPTPPPPPPGGGVETVTIPIASGVDDVEQNGNNNLQTGSTDLDIYPNRRAGLRFLNVCVEPGRQLTSASINFTADRTQSGAAQFTFAAHDVANAPAFNNNGRLNALPLSSTTAQMTVPGWTIRNNYDHDVTAVVNAITSRPDWAGCGNIAFVVTTTGNREAETYESNQNETAKLTITTQADNNPPPPPPGGVETVTIPIAAGVDDVEQNGSNNLQTGSTDLDIYPNRRAGLRFLNVCVEPGRELTSASINFTADRTQSGAAQFTFAAHDVASAPQFNNNTRLHGLPLNSTTAQMTVPGWTIRNNYDHDVTAVVNAITSRPDWAGCGNIAFVITTTGNREAETYESNQNEAAKLTITTQPETSSIPVRIEPADDIDGDSAAVVFVDAGAQVIGAVSVQVTYDVALTTASSCIVHVPAGECSVNNPGIVRFAGIDLEGVAGDIRIGTILYRDPGAPNAALSATLFQAQPNFAGEVLNAADRDGGEVVESEEDDESNEGRRGDANCDGLVTIVDALVIAQLSVGNRIGFGHCPLSDVITMANEPAGDFNGDGIPNVIDSLLIAQCVVGNTNDWCLDPTLSAAWLGQSQRIPGAVTIDWEAIGGATSYEVEWSLNAEVLPLQTGLTAPSASWPVTANERGRICARLRGKNGSEQSEWSPRTCQSLRGPAPAVTFDRDDNGDLRVTWTGNGDLSELAIFVNGDSRPVAYDTATDFLTIDLDVGAAQDDPGAIALQQVPDSASEVCVALRTVSQVAELLDSVLGSQCVAVDDNEVMEVVQRTPLPLLPVGPDGQPAFDADGVLAGGFTLAEVEQFRCADLDAVPLIYPGDVVSGSLSDESTITTRLLGYVFEPDGDPSVSATGTFTAEHGRQNLSATLSPVHTQQFAGTQDGVPLTTTVEFSKTVNGASVGDDQGRIQTPEGDFLPVRIQLRRVGGLNNEWTIDYSATFQTEPLVLDPCTTLTDLARHLSNDPSDIKFIIEGLRQRLEASCLGDWQCVTEQAEAVDGFTVSVECFAALSKPQVDRDQAREACSADGFESIAATLDEAENVNIVLQTDDGSVASIAIEPTVLDDLVNGASSSESWPTPQASISVTDGLATATWSDSGGGSGYSVRWWHDPLADPSPNNDHLLVEVPVSGTSAIFDTEGRTGNLCVEVRAEQAGGVLASDWSARSCASLSPNSCLAQGNCDGTAAGEIRDISSPVARKILVLVAATRASPNDPPLQISFTVDGVVAQSTDANVERADDESGFLLDAEPGTKSVCVELSNGAEVVAQTCQAVDVTGLTDSELAEINADIESSLVLFNYEPHFFDLALGPILGSTPVIAYESGSFNALDPHHLAALENLYAKIEVIDSVYVSPLDGDGDGITVGDGDEDDPCSPGGIRPPCNHPFDDPFDDSLRRLYASANNSLGCIMGQNPCEDLGGEGGDAIFFLGQLAITFVPGYDCADIVVSGAGYLNSAGCALDMTPLVGQAVDLAKLPFRAARIARSDGLLGANGLRRSVETALASGARSVDEVVELTAACTLASFPVGTSVMTSDGEAVDIGRLRVGDELEGLDPRSGESGSHRITGVTRSVGLQRLVTVTTSAGVVAATTEHPFWSIRTAEWVHAADLGPGHLLLAEDGSQVEVLSLSVAVVDVEVVSLDVDGTDSYFVYVGDIAVLVHNAPKCLINGARLSSSKLRQALRDLPVPDIGPGFEKWQAHHIVPIGDRRAAPIRELIKTLSEAEPGNALILDEALNGIWLPNNKSATNPDGLTPHNETFRNDYFNVLGELFANVSNVDEAVEAIDAMKELLQGGERFITGSPLLDFPPG